MNGEEEVWWQTEGGYPSVGGVPVKECFFSQVKGARMESNDRGGGSCKEWHRSCAPSLPPLITAHRSFWKHTGYPLLSPCAGNAVCLPL